MRSLRGMTLSDRCENQTAKPAHATGNLRVKNVLKPLWMNKGISRLQNLKVCVTWAVEVTNLKLAWYVLYWSLYRNNRPDWSVEVSNVL